jgi:hypothetical protein
VSNSVSSKKVHLDNIMDLLMCHKDRLTNKDLIETEKVGRSRIRVVWQKLNVCIGLQVLNCLKEGKSLI